MHVLYCDSPMACPTTNKHVMFIVLFCCVFGFSNDLRTNPFVSDLINEAHCVLVSLFTPAVVYFSPKFQVLLHLLHFGKHLYEVQPTSFCPISAKHMNKPKTQPQIRKRNNRTRNAAENSET